jgi:hypothetical protein
MRNLALCALLMACGGEGEGSLDDTGALETDTDTDTDTDSGPTVNVEDWLWAVDFDGTVSSRGQNIWSDGYSNALFTADRDGTSDAALAAEGCGGLRASMAGNNQFSISMWVKPSIALDSSVTDRQMLTVFAYGPWQIFYSRGYWESEFYGERSGVLTTRTQETVPANVWRHMAWVVDGSQAITMVYVNGVAVAQGEFFDDESVRGVTGALNFGCTGGQRTNGPFAIDEVRVYDYPLTSEQLALLSQ